LKGEYAFETHLYTGKWNGFLFKMDESTPVELQDEQVHEKR